MHYTKEHSQGGKEAGVLRTVSPTHGLGVKLHLLRGASCSSHLGGPKDHHQMTPQKGHLFLICPKVSNRPVKALVVLQSGKRVKRREAPLRR